ncbi:MAG: hypothetical protein JO283_02100 [Bradyrhizobium sp.]|nr:hypothetical protein [Bradyrhizobium sp.]
MTAFLRGLKETGFVDGQNVAFEYRWARGQYGKLSALAEDLVRHQVAVITTGGGPGPALAAKTATNIKTTPIVFNHGSNPFEQGSVKRLNHPGENATKIRRFRSAHDLV